MSFDVTSWLEGMSKNTKSEPQFLKVLGERVARVVEVMRHQAEGGDRSVSGKITVEFNLELVGNQVITTPKISSKEPAASLTPGTAYIGADGALVDQDPRQFQFTFKGGGMSERSEMKGETTEKKVSGAAGQELKAPQR